jgi:hypothetical protein
VVYVKKTLSIALVLALVIAFALPAVAFAGKGGVKGPNSVRGGAAASDDDGQAPSRGKKPVKAPKELRAAEDSDEAAETSDEEGGSTENTPPMGPGQTKGITNALTRIEATFLRMKADVDSGLRKKLPPGLLRVFEKFFGWLDQPAEFQETWDSIEASRTPAPSTDDLAPESEPDAEPEVIVEPMALPDPLPSL